VNPGAPWPPSAADPGVCIAHDPGARLRDTAASVGITERSAYGIITDLTEAGYVVKQKDGRRNRYQIQAYLPRQPGTRHQRRPRPPRGHRRETAADPDRTSLRPPLGVHACTPAGGRRRAGRRASSGQRSAMDPRRRRASSWPASGHGSSQSLTRLSLLGLGRQARTASVLRLLEPNPFFDRG
jgi:hypothetical protein